MSTTVDGGLSASRSGSGPSPVAVRLSRRRWRDPRLLVGLVLVGASAVGVAAVVAAADERVGMWVVRGDLPAGAQVIGADLIAAEVQVPDQAAYWPVTDEVPADLVATRDFGDGELLTRAGVAPQDASRMRNVTVPVQRTQMPSDLAVGSRVDVYVIGHDAAGQPVGAPRVVLRDAIVSAVDDDAGAFGGASLAVGVALSLRDEQVAKVLAAQAQGTVTLVDVPVAP